MHLDPYQFFCLVKPFGEVMTPKLLAGEGGMEKDYCSHTPLGCTF